MRYLYGSLFVLGGPPEGCMLSVPQRFVVEICCSQHCYLCRPSIAGGDVSLLRITQKDDLRDERTYQRVLHILRKWGRSSLAWISIPCTGGSPWQRMNVHRNGDDAARRVDAHISLFRELWQQACRLIADSPNTLFVVE